jgi:hypothetical protein
LKLPLSVVRFRPRASFLVSREGAMEATAGKVKPISRARRVGKFQKFFPETRKIPRGEHIRAVPNLIRVDECGAAFHLRAR